MVRPMTFKHPYTNIECPCKGCKKRYLECHSNCECYQMFVNDIKKNGQKVRAEKYKRSL